MRVGSLAGLKKKSEGKERPVRVLQIKATAVNVINKV